MRDAHAVVVRTVARAGSAISIREAAELVVIGIELVAVFKRAGGLARASFRCVSRCCALFVMGEEARAFETFPQRVTLGCYLKLAATSCALG